MNKQTKFSLGTITVLGLLKIFSIVPFTRMAADDFSSALVAKDGLWNAFIYTYTHRFGRFTSTLFESTIVSNIGDTKNVVFYTFVTFAALFLAFYLVYKRWLKVGWRKLHPYLLAGASFAILYYLSPNKVESWYFLSASVIYLWPITLILFAVSFLFKKKYERNDYILSFIFVFLAVGCNEIFGFLTTATLSILFLLSSKKSKSRKMLLTMSGAAIFSFLIVSLAPGNKVRLNGIEGDPMNPIGAVLYSMQIVPVVLGPILRNGAKFLVPLTFVLSSVLLETKVVSSSREKIDTLLIKIFLLIAALFLASVIHVLPAVYGLGRVPPDRVNVSLAFFVLAIVVAISYHFAKLFQVLEFTKRLGYKLLVFVASVALFVAGTTFTNNLSTDVYTAGTYAKAYDAMITSFKERAASGNKETIIVSLPDPGLLPATLDPPGDYDYKNDALSRYYGVGKIFSE